MTAKVDTHPEGGDGKAGSVHEWRGAAEERHSPEDSASPKVAEAVEVTQADREAAADLIEAYWSGLSRESRAMQQLASDYRNGHTQGVWAVAFARHRIAALSPTPAPTKQGASEASPLSEPLFSAGAGPAPGSAAEGASDALDLDRYDAGLLGDGGGGDVDWWQNYIRDELERAHDFYQSQADTLASPIRDAAIEEAAEVAEAKDIGGIGNNKFDAGYDAACRNIASAIRALKTKASPSREGEKS